VYSTWSAVPMEKSHGNALRSSAASAFVLAHARALYGADRAHL
jgi:hypothetical protein